MDEVTGGLAASLAGAVADLTAIVSDVLPVPAGRSGAVARMLDQIAQEISEVADTVRQMHGAGS